MARQSAVPLETPVDVARAVDYLERAATLAFQAGALIEAGVLGPALFPADIPREEVFAAAGTSLEAVSRAADRGQAITRAAQKDPRERFPTA